jgi:hypothetical protein
LIHDVIKGVAGHADGVGQCFIDTRNVSNGVTECLKVSINFIINDLIKNKRELFGWYTAMQLLKSEYDLDLTQGDTALYTTTFVTEYNEGAFQSGGTELLYAAKTESTILFFHQLKERHGVQ